MIVIKWDTERDNEFAMRKLRHLGKVLFLSNETAGGFITWVEWRPQSPL